jgi:hypothetical protein
MEVEKRKGKGEQGNKTAGESKEKEKPRPCIYKKNGTKKEDPIKKLHQETGLPGHPTYLPSSSL